ncbi:MAG: ComF family protein [Bacteroidota bacterium]
MKILDYFNDFLNLFFPAICLTCGNRLVKNEHCICIPCLYDIPRVKFKNYSENQVIRMFLGRTNIQYAMAYYYFSRGSKYRNLIHQLKYNRQKEIGTLLGKQLGNELLHSPMRDVDIIIPVPLHKKKLMERGYNQSEVIATGIGHVLNKPVITNVLYRTVNTKTQTKKSRYERWENIKDVFQLQNKSLLKGEHVLLVDDVITTGATLESCALTMTKQEDVTISIAVVAMA